MIIVKKQIKYNKKVRTIPIKYIVVHYTQNYRRGANPSMHYRYFNNAYRGSSADIFVDDKSAWYINNYKLYYTWAIGDRKYYSGRQGKVNINSVQVEICVNSDSNLSVAIENTKVVIRNLMDELNIPIENVVRHMDCSGKLCPLFFVKKDKYEENWKQFKKDVDNMANKNYDEIIMNSDLDAPKRWLDAINNLKNGIVTLEDLEIYKWIPAFIEKIYKNK